MPVEAADISGGGGKGKAVRLESSVKLKYRVPLRLAVYAGKETLARMRDRLPFNCRYLCI